MMPVTAGKMMAKINQKSRSSDESVVGESWHQNATF